MATDGGTVGVVLAGGRSQRLGTDKALLRVDGGRLVDRAVAALGTVCDRVVVAEGLRPLVTAADAHLADAVADAGPLGGVLAGLEHAVVCGATDLSVLAVDHVRPDPGLLRHLRAVRGEADVALCEVDGRWQPLHASWSPSAAPAVRRSLAEGVRAVREALARLELRVVTASELAAVGLDVTFAGDLDTPDDVARLLRPEGGPPRA